MSSNTENDKIPMERQVPLVPVDSSVIRHDACIKPGKLVIRQLDCDECYCDTTIVLERGFLVTYFPDQH